MFVYTVATAQLLMESLVKLHQVTVNMLKTEDVIMCLLIWAITHLRGWIWMIMVINSSKLKKLGNNPAAVPLCAP
jgi:hypothetical protein